MATYYHHQGSETQAPDGLQTLVLMNPPSYVHYSSADAPPQTATSSLVFLNSAAGGTLSHHHQAPPSQTQQFVGIPLSAASQDPGSQAVHVAHDISPLHGLISPVQYNLWNPAAAMDSSGRETPRSLSLSLSSQNPGGFRSFNWIDAQPPLGPASGGGSPSSASGVTNGVAGIQSALLSSKYLKAAQELLEEVVNVGNGMKLDSPPSKNSDNQSRANKATGAAMEEESSSKNSAELSIGERQEIQMKKAKLMSMLEEVEQRYRQYHHQMQIVISSFEQAAGIGSAKTYTALALQTISKQFRCLKDAITGQIRSAGEEESPAGKIQGSRLKFVDHHLRQLGVMQHNAWRPQRGLPERSVSILRAWLFEHFLHPYPKDSDKHMLAKQTGLTRSQVSNWFINARVRVWKPMVEEMYTEEMKEHDGKTSKSTSTPPPESNTNMTNFKETNSTNYDTPPISTNSGSSVGDGITLQQVSPKKARSSSEMMTSNNVASMDREGYSNFIGRFGADQFNPFGGVSLTLGLPHTDNLSLSIDHQEFLPNQNIQLGRRVEVADHQGNHFGAINAPIPPHSSNTYQNINMKEVTIA